MEFKRRGAGIRNSQNVLKWFCQCFPSWHKVLVYGLATERFLVCHFPFLKIEKRNSRFFITRKYLFHCSPRFTGNTLGVFNHPTRLFRSQILFLVISRIPQVSVLFPLVSTIGEACFPEVRVFVSFHFSKCWCYSWVLLSLARLIFRRACSFAISENSRSLKKAASLTFSTPSIYD